MPRALMYTEIYRLASILTLHILWPRRIPARVEISDQIMVKRMVIHLENITFQETVSVIALNSKGGTNMIFALVLSNTGVQFVKVEIMVLINVGVRSMSQINLEIQNPEPHKTHEQEIINKHILYLPKLTSNFLSLTAQ